MSFPGVLRPFRSGSGATRFTNDPVSDADGGVVMDRRVYPALGPDGDGELPSGLVGELRDAIRPLLVDAYPEIRIELMKRGLLIRCNEPLLSGEDPTVDMVVALNRVEDNALWIPNLDQNRWDASDPEQHVVLFTAGSESLRQTRRHVVGVAKAQVRQFAAQAVCSFSVVALAWECIQQGESLALQVE